MMEGKDLAGARGGRDRRVDREERRSRGESARNGARRIRDVRVGGRTDTWEGSTPHRENASTVVSRHRERTHAECDGRIRDSIMSLSPVKSHQAHLSSEEVESTASHNR